MLHIIGSQFGRSTQATSRCERCGHYNTTHRSRGYKLRTGVLAIYYGRNRHPGLDDNEDGHTTLKVLLALGLPDEDVYNLAGSWITQQKLRAIKQAAKRFDRSPENIGKELKLTKIERQKFGWFMKKGKLVKHGGVFAIIPCDSTRKELKQETEQRKYANRKKKRQKDKEARAELIAQIQATRPGGEAAVYAAIEKIERRPGIKIPITVRDIRDEIEKQPFSVRSQLPFKAGSRRRAIRRYLDQLERRGLIHTGYGWYGKGNERYLKPGPKSPHTTQDTPDTRTARTTLRHDANRLIRQRFRAPATRTPPCHRLREGATTCPPHEAAPELHQHTPFSTANAAPQSKSNGHDPTPFSTASPVSPPAAMPSNGNTTRSKRQERHIQAVKQQKAVSSLAAAASRNLNGHPHPWPIPLAPGEAELLKLEREVEQEIEQEAYGGILVNGVRYPRVEQWFEAHGTNGLGGIGVDSRNGGAGMSEDKAGDRDAVLREGPDILEALYRMADRLPPAEFRQPIVDPASRAAAEVLLRDGRAALEAALRWKAELDAADEGRARG